MESIEVSVYCASEFWRTDLHFSGIGRCVVCSDIEKHLVLQRVQHHDGRLTAPVAGITSGCEPLVAGITSGFEPRQMGQSLYKTNYSLKLHGSLKIGHAEDL